MLQLSSALDLREIRKDQSKESPAMMGQENEPSSSFLFLRLLFLSFLRPSFLHPPFFNRNRVSLVDGRFFVVLCLLYAVQLGLNGGLFVPSRTDVNK